MKKQRFAIQTRQLICPQCRQYIGRQETRRVRIGKGYQVKGVPGFDYGELCKDCAEKQELAKGSHRLVDGQQVTPAPAP